jgi:hypothetical protein
VIDGAAVHAHVLVARVVAAEEEQPRRTGFEVPHSHAEAMAPKLRRAERQLRAGQNALLDAQRLEVELLLRGARRAFAAGDYLDPGNFLDGHN